jgi:thiol:disulfide interchange protein DsbD
VAKHLRSDFVLLRLYTDDADKGPALQRYQQQTIGTVALPSYAVITPEGSLTVQHSGMASPEAFDAFLEKGLSQFSGDATPQSFSRRGPSSSSAKGDSKERISSG